MLKECKVLINNEAVTVIQYGDEKVQIPAIGFKADKIKVKDDGSYTVVPDQYMEPEQASGKRAKKQAKKKPAAAAETASAATDE